MQGMARRAGRGPSPASTSIDPSARAGALGMNRRFVKYHGGLPSLSYADLQRIQNSNPLIVDVRTREERDVSFIPGSVTPSEVKLHLHPAQPIRPVVSVCTVGLRAGIWAKEFARNERYTGPVYVSEGILLHAFDGGELVRRESDDSGNDVYRRVNSLHCFANYFRFSPDGWETVVFSPLAALKHSLALLPSLIVAYFDYTNAPVDSRKSAEICGDSGAI